MTFKKLFSTWGVSSCVLVLVLNAFEHPATAADAWTVQKLNDSKPWDRIAESQVSIRIEGRIGSFGGGQFRLQHCDAKFTVDNAKLKFVPAKSVVEVKGKFKRVGEKLEFAVDELKVMSGYVEQFDVRASKLKRPTSEEWIELGDWIAERGRFYDDDELSAKAKEAYTNAIEVEYKSLKLTDAEGRFALAKKIETYKLSSRRQMELIHEGLRIQWTAAQKTAQLKEWKALSTSIEQRLPGSTEVLKTVAADIKENYEQDPVAIYRAADDPLRTQLHRLFLVSVTRKIIMHDASSDGRDGDSIAEQIDRLIPEEHALAEKQRTLQLGYRISKIGTATRSEVENLVTRFLERREIDNARQAIVQWIKAHESRLKSDGVLGLMRLADEYLTLLHDEPVAVDYLKEAYKMDPNAEGLKTKLIALGYQLRAGNWVKSNQNPVEANVAARQAPTSIQLGMSATDLRNLLGQPRSLLRTISARGISEIWSFGAADSSSLVIRLEQKTRDAEPKVTLLPSQ